jgi:hypothetical protein
MRSYMAPLFLRSCPVENMVIYRSDVPSEHLPFTAVGFPQIDYEVITAAISAIDCCSLALHKTHHRYTQ